jgi:hypothetical protein
MNGELIHKRDNTQEPPAKLRHCGPKAKAIVLLRLAANRVLNDSDKDSKFDYFLAKNNAVGIRDRHEPRNHAP